LLLILFGLLVVAAFSVLARAGVLLCVGQPTQNRTSTPAIIFMFEHPEISSFPSSSPDKTIYRQEPHFHKEGSA
jgi:hypothetical protein